MATRLLLEYVPYVDEDEDEAIARQPQALHPTLVARRESPATAPVSRFLPKPEPEVSPSTRTLLTMAAGVVLLASFLMLALHFHTPPAVAAAAHARHPAATLLAPEAVYPAKPSAYGEAFTPASPARRPRTRIALAPTPSPADSSESALH